MGGCVRVSNTSFDAESNDDAENLSLPDVGAAFPIESYGQNETAQTSVKAQDDPGALLQYMDRFVDTGDLATKDEEIRSALLENQTDIEEAQNQVGLDSRVQEAPCECTVNSSRRSTQRMRREIVALERKIAEERAVREGIDQQLAELITRLKGASVASTLAAIESSIRADDLRVGQTEFEEIVSLTKAFQEIAKTSENKLVREAETFSAKVREQLAFWKEREQKVQMSIDEKRRELKAQGIRLDHAFIKKLATDESNYKESLKTLSRWAASLQTLRENRHKYLSERRKIRSRIFTARMAYSVRANQALKDALGDLNVSVKFVEGGLSDAAEVIIQQAMGWRTSQVPRGALLVEQVTVPGLLTAIRKTDTGAITKVTTPDRLQLFNKSDAQALLAELAQEPVLFNSSDVRLKTGRRLLLRRR